MLFKMATINSLELSGHLCPPSMLLLLSPTINIISAIQTLSKSRDSQHCSRHSCIWVQMFPWNYLTLGDMKHRHIWEVVTLKNKKALENEPFVLIENEEAIGFYQLLPQKLTSAARKFEPAVILSGHNISASPRLGAITQRGTKAWG